jgi:hypothetical protein
VIKDPSRAAPLSPTLSQRLRADIFAESEGVVDLLATGISHPDYVPPPEPYRVGDPVSDPDAATDREGTNTGAWAVKKLTSWQAKAAGINPKRTPEDRWIAEAAMRVIAAEDPDVLYVVLAECDTSQHIFGSADAPDEWDDNDTPGILWDDENVFNKKANRDPILDIVHEADASFGLLVDVVRARNVLDDSFVVLLSDHGQTTVMHTKSTVLDVGKILTREGVGESDVERLVSAGQFAWIALTDPAKGPEIERSWKRTKPPPMMGRVVAVRGAGSRRDGERRRRRGRPLHRRRNRREPPGELTAPGASIFRRPTTQGALARSHAVHPVSLSDFTRPGGGGHEAGLGDHLQRPPRRPRHHFRDPGNPRPGGAAGAYGGRRFPRGHRPPAAPAPGRRPPRERGWEGHRVDPELTMKAGPTPPGSCTMNVRFGACVLALGALALSGCARASAQKEQTERKEPREREPHPEGEPRVRTLRPGGGRLDWCHKSGLIAFDALGKDEYFDIHTMKADGSGDTCLSCGIKGLPERHVGQPAWHPSCRYLVVQAEKQEHIKIRFSHALTPGAGILNDLWLIDVENRSASPLRQVADDRGTGTLHPHFSEDGAKLSWSEMEDKGGFKKGKELGYWKLMVADFLLEKGKPRLENVREFTPGGKGFYENHGFSPDGKKLIYTSNTEAKRFANNIYVMDLENGKTIRLTDGDYNEHAIFSPDGKRIVWISSTGNEKGGTDYWIMNADGSGKRRVTFFNQKGHPMYAGRRVVVADSAWSPDGKSFVGYYRAGGAIESVKDEIQIVSVDLPDIVVGDVPR